MIPAPSLLYHPCRGRLVSLPCIRRVAIPVLTDAVALLRTEEVAQIYQQDGSDLQEAMNAYEKAGEWYSSEDANAWVVPHPQTHMAMHCY